MRDELSKKGDPSKKRFPIALLKSALDRAWARLPPERQATMLKTTLAERILKSAAQGERDHKRLMGAALRSEHYNDVHRHTC